MAGYDSTISTICSEFSQLVAFGPIKYPLKQWHSICRRGMRLFDKPKVIWFHSSFKILLPIRSAVPRDHFKAVPVHRMEAVKLQQNRLLSMYLRHSTSLSMKAKQWCWWKIPILLAILKIKCLIKYVFPLSNGMIIIMTFYISHLAATGDPQTVQHFTGRHHRSITSRRLHLLQNQILHLYANRIPNWTPRRGNQL